MNRYSRIFLALVGFMVVTANIMPAIAADVDTFALPRTDAPGPGTQRLINIINRLTNWLLGLLITLAVVFIIYAAYLYLTAAGNEENVGKAKNVIIYAAIAIAVGLLSRVIVFLVRGLIGG